MLIIRAYFSHVNTIQDDNVTLKTWHPEGPNGQVEKRTDILAHHEVLLRLDAMDLERGASPCPLSTHFDDFSLNNLCRGKDLGSSWLLSHK
jgi:hypothetical protein